MISLTLTALSLLFWLVVCLLVAAGFIHVICKAFTPGGHDYRSHVEGYVMPDYLRTPWRVTIAQALWPWGWEDSK